jgi:hypothetical protein
LKEGPKDLSLFITPARLKGDFTIGKRRIQTKRNFEIFNAKQISTPVGTFQTYGNREASTVF